MRKELEMTMQRLEYPAEAVESFLLLYDRCTADSERMSSLQELMETYWSDADSIYRVLGSLRDVAVSAAENFYSIHHLFFLMLTPELRRRYAQANIPEWVFWNSMLDLRAKLMECRKLYGVWGSELFGWFDGFFRLDRFGLGRLQFEPRYFQYDAATVHGITLHKGDPVINIHIPSLGPLKKELRQDAYRKAYEFFRDRFQGYVPIVCSSWLLYPRYAECLPADSNVVDFGRDFHIVHVESAGPGLENFGASWRVFNKPKGTPAEQLPRDTRMQRAYLDWFARGGDSGFAHGVLIVDEKGIYND